jgi:hypothetical protein
MMSCMTSAVWSRPVSSPCYTKHGQRRGVVLLDRITTVGMFRTGQLSRHCTVELNCSGMSTCLADASVTHERALEIWESSYVPSTAKPFFIRVAHSPLGAMGYVAAPELSSWGGRARSYGTRGSTRVHLDREVRSGAEEHVAASELNSARRRGPGPRGSTRVHLGRKARSGAKEHVVASELNSARRRCPGPRDT